MLFELLSILKYPPSPKVPTALIKEVQRSYVISRFLKVDKVQTIHCPLRNFCIYIQYIVGYKYIQYVRIKTRPVYLTLTTKLFHKNIKLFESA